MANERAATDWSRFDAAYKKACESSQPRDWMEAALAAQQVRWESTRSETAAPDDLLWKKGFKWRDGEAPQSASAEPTPMFPQPEALMHFLQAAARGEVTGDIGGWSQFRMACRWAVEKIEAPQSATATKGAGCKHRSFCHMCAVDRRNDDDPDA